MPTYGYRAYGARGTVETGTLDSPSEAAAVETLRALGLTVVELTEGAVAASQPWWKREISLSGGALALGEQAALAEQMATMLRVRLPALEMLRILAQGTDRADTRDRLERTARWWQKACRWRRRLNRRGRRWHRCSCRCCGRGGNRMRCPNS